MTRDEVIEQLKTDRDLCNFNPMTGEEEPMNEDCRKSAEALDIAIKALKQEPYEKFESVKDHICKLAGDYKCWDNRLTYDEALELCHILEQEPCEDAVSRKAVLDMATVIETDDYSGNEIMKVVDTEDIKALPSVKPASKPEQSCEDAVSRQAVLNTLNRMDSVLDENRTVETYKELLIACYNDLPPVTPTHIETVTEFADKCRECGKQKTKWIPVSEKLPEEDGDYLLWGKIDEDEDEYTFIGSYDSGCEEFGIWQEQFDRTTLGCLGSDFFEYASVIAWMPLPEPYKSESEGEE